MISSKWGKIANKIQIYLEKYIVEKHSQPFFGLLGI
jgi:hypothetical protein